jgi:hypothetical protein
MTRQKLVEMLNYTFSRFEGLAKKCGIEKTKTIDNACMAASGIPEPCEKHGFNSSRFLPVQ